MTYSAVGTSEILNFILLFYLELDTDLGTWESELQTLQELSQLS
jgi:hypothetical protein